MSLWMVTCKMCGFEYGAFRPQCPPCGHPAPPLASGRVADDEPIRQRKPRKQRERRVSKSACAFCTMRGAKTTCKQCSSLLHRHCVALHTCKEES